MHAFRRTALTALVSGVLLAGVAPAVADPGDSTAAVEGGLRAQAVGSTANLLPNGDFSAGKTNWTAGNRHTILQVTNGGRDWTPGARLERRLPGTVALTALRDVDTDTQPGDEFSGSAYVRSAGRRLGGALVLREMDAAGNVVQRQVEAFQARAGWAPVAVRLTASQAGTRVDVRVRGAHVTRASALLVDDVAVLHQGIPTPTP